MDFDSEDIQFIDENSTSSNNSTKSAPSQSEAFGSYSDDAFQQETSNYDDPIATNDYDPLDIQENIDLLGERYSEDVEVTEEDPDILEEIPEVNPQPPAKPKIVIYPDELPKRPNEHHDSSNYDPVTKKFKYHDKSHGLGIYERNFANKMYNPFEIQEHQVKNNKYFNQKIINVNEIIKQRSLDLKQRILQKRKSLLATQDKKESDFNITKASSISEEQFMRVPKITKAANIPKQKFWRLPTKPAVEKDDFSIIPYNPSPTIRTVNTGEVRRDVRISNNITRVYSISSIKNGSKEETRFVQKHSNIASNDGRHLKKNESPQIKIQTIYSCSEGVKGRLPYMQKVIDDPKKPKKFVSEAAIESQKVQKVLKSAKIIYEASPSATQPSRTVIQPKIYEPVVSNASTSKTQKVYRVIPKPAPTEEFFEIELENEDTEEPYDVEQVDEVEEIEEVKTDSDESTSSEKETATSDPEIPQSSFERQSRCKETPMRPQDNSWNSQEGQSTSTAAKYPGRHQEKLTCDVCKQSFLYKVSLLVHQKSNQCFYHMQSK